MSREDIHCQDGPQHFCKSLLTSSGVKSIHVCLHMNSVHAGAELMLCSDDIVIVAAKTIACEELGHIRTL